MAKVNEKEVKKLMESLEISREEAIELLSFDNGEADNEEVNNIDKKAKENESADKGSKKGKKGSSLDKVKNQKAKKKVDEVKEKLMSKVMAMLQLADVKKPQQLTSTKVTFKVGEEFYSITLTKHKAKPDGYAD